MSTHAETERTYEPGPDAPVPELTGGAVASVTPPVTEELLTTYHDTASLALSRAGVSLRRRTGADEGWHLKVPVGGDTKLELRRALGRGRRPPVALRQAVTSLVAAEPLAEVADLRTTRTTRQLRSADGTTLALVCDDTVVVDRLDGGEAPASWREIEVELVDGGAEVLDEVEAALASAGIRPSPAGSKIRRALGVDDAGAPGPGLRSKSVGAHLHRYLLEQRGRLAEADLRHRVRGESVHDLRVATRRTRAVLAVYRSLLDAERARHVQDELQWLGRELGELRDLEVARELVVAGLDDDEPLTTGPARKAVREHLRGLERVARRRATEALTSTRYAEALQALDELLRDPGWTERAAEPATRALPDLLRKPRRRLVRAVDAAQETTGPAGEAAWHHVRKSAKRLRYAVEVAEPALPRSGRVGERAKALQSALGDHLDQVRLSTLVAYVGHEAPASAAFVLGRLHARIEAGQAEDRRASDRALGRLLRDKRLRRLDRLR